MLRPKPQPHNAEIHFAVETVSKDSKINRTQLLQTMQLPVEGRLHNREEVPREKVKERVEKEVQEEEEKEVQEEVEKEVQEEARKVVDGLEKYKGERLIYQTPGSSWICPRIASLQERADVYTSCPEWWNALLRQKKGALFWEWKDGSWTGTSDKPCNFSRLAEEDQQAVDAQILASLREKYRLLHETIPDVFAPVVIIDQIELFCDRVLHKDPVAMKLHQALRATRVIGITQFPCYRNPAALPLMDALLLPRRLQTRRQLQPSRITRRRNKTDVFYDTSEIMPKWATVPFEIERVPQFAKGQKHLVYTRNVEFQVSDDKLRVHILREDIVVEDEENVDVFVLVNNDTGNLWARLKHIDVVHILELPRESLVQLFQVACCARHSMSDCKTVRLVLYLTPATMESRLMSALTKTTVAKDDGSPLYQYCVRYLGDQPVKVSTEEKILEDLLVQDHAVRKSIRVL